MGKSSTAVLLIAGTDVIPDVDGYRRRDVVRTGDDAKPVLQCVLSDRVGKLGERALSHVPHHSTSPELSSPLGPAVSVENLGRSERHPLRTTSKDARPERAAMRRQARTTCGS